MKRLHNREGKLNYLFTQTSLTTSLKVVVTPHFDKNQQKKCLQPWERLPTTPFFTQHMLPTPQNLPMFRLEQTYSCHIPFEREISDESHFSHQKTPVKS